MTAVMSELHALQASVAATSGKYCGNLLRGLSRLIAPNKLNVIVECLSFFPSAAEVFSSQPTGPLQKAMASRQFRALSDADVIVMSRCERGTADDE